MDEGRIIFENYNRAVEKAYDSYISDNKKKDISKFTCNDEQQMKDLVSSAVRRWEDEPMAELGGLTPKSYFNGIGDLQKLFELFKTAARVCDEGLPPLLTDKLSAAGKEAIDGLLELACDRNLINEKEDDFLIPLTAIRVLGSMKAEAAVKPFIELLLSVDEDNDIFMEGLKEALINIGAQAVDQLAGALAGAGELGGRHEYLMMALSDAGRLRRSDAVYRCLKDAFHRMKSKAVGALCLGNYGDGRAIPALRGFLEKNRGSLGRETYYEIKSVIEHLGGNTEGL